MTKNTQHAQGPARVFAASLRTILERYWGELGARGLRV